MSYHIKTRIVWPTKASFSVAERACWHYNSDNSWSEEGGFLTLHMGGSGTCGMLRFMTKDNKEPFYVVMGVHNYSPWLDVVCDLAADTTSTNSLPAYYVSGPKASAREATEKAIHQVNSNNRKITAEFSAVQGYDLDVIIVIYDN